MLQKYTKRTNTTPTNTQITPQRNEWAQLFNFSFSQGLIALGNFRRWFPFCNFLYNTHNPGGAIERFQRNDENSKKKRVKNSFTSWGKSNSLLNLQHKRQEKLMGEKRLSKELPFDCSLLSAISWRITFKWAYTLHHLLCVRKFIMTKVVSLCVHVCTFENLKYVVQWVFRTE